MEFILSQRSKPRSRHRHEEHPGSGQLDQRGHREMDRDRESRQSITMGKKPRRPATRASGISLLEALLAAPLTAVVFLAAIRPIPNMPRLFQQYQLRSQLYADSQTCMDSIARILRKADTSTIVVCSCGANLCSPGCAVSA